jgi:hypothetical protein
MAASQYVPSGHGWETQLWGEVTHVPLEHVAPGGQSLFAPHPVWHTPDVLRHWCPAGQASSRQFEGAATHSCVDSLQRRPAPVSVAGAAGLKADRVGFALSGHTHIQSGAGVTAGSAVRWIGENVGARAAVYPGVGEASVTRVDCTTVARASIGAAIALFGPAVGCRAWADARLGARARRTGAGTRKKKDRSPPLD